MVSFLEASRAAPQGGDRALVHRAVNACLCPLYAVEGCHVVTVEGEGLPWSRAPAAQMVGGPVHIFDMNAECWQLLASPAAWCRLREGLAAE